MINVHASGGTPMLQAAARSGAEAAARAGVVPPLLIAVTVLTSMDEPTLREVGVERPLAGHVVALARLARAAGLHGVVASPLEIAAIRAACGPDFVIVTPGIRGAAAGAVMNDQARTMGPGDAVRAGATFIVVGRPVIGAADPRQAAAAIVAELAAVPRPTTVR
jgi:orotidine-5'-phosphate decarboxylase